MRNTNNLQSNSNTIQTKTTQFHTYLSKSTSLNHSKTHLKFNNLLTKSNLKSKSLSMLNFLKNKELINKTGSPNKPSHKQKLSNFLNIHLTKHNPIIKSMMLIKQQKRPYKNIIRIQSKHISNNSLNNIYSTRNNMHRGISYSTYNINDVKLKLLNENVPSNYNERRSCSPINNDCPCEGSNIKVQVKQMRIPVLYRKSKNEKINELNRRFIYEYYNERTKRKYKEKGKNDEECNNDNNNNDKEGGSIMKVNSVYLNEVVGYMEKKDSRFKSFVIEDGRFPLRNLEIINQTVKSAKNSKIFFPK